MNVERYSNYYHESLVHQEASGRIHSDNENIINNIRCRNDDVKIPI